MNLLQILQGLVFCLCASLLPVSAGAHGEYGRPDKPITLVDIPVRLHDASTHTLQTLLSGKITALQLVFTRCSSICPIQASVFEAIDSVNEQTNHEYQLLSISIDPEYDNPQFLAQWRDRWAASDNSRWLVGASDYLNTFKLVEQLSSDDRLADVTVYRSSNSKAIPASSDHHSAQLYFIGPEGELLYRSFEFARKEVVMQLFSQISQSLHPKTRAPD